MLGEISFYGEIRCRVDWEYSWGPQGPLRHPFPVFAVQNCKFTSKWTTLEKSRGKLENGRPNIFVDFRRAILWGACGGEPGSIGALGSAIAPYELQNAWNLPKICWREPRGTRNRLSEFAEMAIALDRLIPLYWCAGRPPVIIGASETLQEWCLAVLWKVSNAPLGDFTYLCRVL